MTYEIQIKLKESGTSLVVEGVNKSNYTPDAAKVKPAYTYHLEHRRLDGTQIANGLPTKIVSTGFEGSVTFPENFADYISYIVAVERTDNGGDSNLDYFVRSGGEELNLRTKEFPFKANQDPLMNAKALNDTSNNGTIEYNEITVAEANEKIKMELFVPKGFSKYWTVKVDGKLYNKSNNVFEFNQLLQNERFEFEINRKIMGYSSYVYVKFETETGILRTLTNKNVEINYPIERKPQVYYGTTVSSDNAKAINLNYPLRLIKTVGKTYETNQYITLMPNSFISKSKVQSYTFKFRLFKSSDNTLVKEINLDLGKELNEAKEIKLDNLQINQTDEYYCQFWFETDLGYKSLGYKDKSKIKYDFSKPEKPTIKLTGTINDFYEDTQVGQDLNFKVNLPTGLVSDDNVFYELPNTDSFKSIKVGSASNYKMITIPGAKLPNKNKYRLRAYIVTAKGNASDIDSKEFAIGVPNGGNPLEIVGNEEKMLDNGKGSGYIDYVAHKDKTELKYKIKFDKTKCKLGNVIELTFSDGTNADVTQSVTLTADMINAGEIEYKSSNYPEETILTMTAFIKDVDSRSNVSLKKFAIRRLTKETIEEILNIPGGTGNASDSKNPYAKLVKDGAWELPPLDKIEYTIKKDFERSKGYNDDDWKKLGRITFTENNVYLGIGVGYFRLKHELNMSDIYNSVRNKPTIVKNEDVAVDKTKLTFAKDLYQNRLLRKSEWIKAGRITFTECSIHIGTGDDTIDYFNDDIQKFILNRLAVLKEFKK